MDQFPAPRAIRTLCAFSDPRRFSIGVRNQTGTRQAMPLFNMAWKSSFFWDGRAPSLRAQALMPIQDHAEMDQTLEGAVSNSELRERNMRRSLKRRLAQRKLPGENRARDRTVCADVDLV